jgi:glycogen(starch) synthase
MTMRQILLPSDVFPPRCGGAGWSAHALATALQQAGEQVTAFVPRISQAATRVTPIHGINTVEVAVPRMPIRMLQPTISAHHIQQALRSHIDPTQTTIIHAQHILSAQAAIALQNATTKVVITVRDHWPWDMRATGMQMPGDQRSWQGMWATLQARQARWSQRLLLPAYVWQMRQRAALLARADAVIAVSEHMAQRIRTHVPQANVVAIPNMVDVAQIQQTVATAPTGVIPERFALFVGKLEPNKGAELLPELILRSRPPALVVAGDGALKATILRAAQQANVPCVMLDWVNHDDVLRLMARCECLWFPSSWDEPLSRTLLEALACGAPIVAMPTGGTAEIIVPNQSGILADTVIDMAASIQRLHEHPELRQQLSQGALQRALQYFGGDVVHGQVLALYDRLGGTSS